MKIPDHLLNHAIEYIFAGAMVLIGLGALSYMDNRHLGRAESIEDQIWEVDQEITRLELYNEFGSESNIPARNQIIKQLENEKSRLEHKLDGLK